MSARTLKCFQKKLHTFPVRKRDRQTVRRRWGGAKGHDKAPAARPLALTNPYARRQATVSTNALLCGSEVVEVVAYIVQLPRGDVRRFGMFSNIVVQSEEIPSIVSLQPGYAVRLMRAEMLMAAVMGQMFPTWRIEPLTEITHRPPSGRPVLLHPAILALEKDAIVAPGPAGHVDRGANRPVHR
jgi:hypothetical protein